MSRALLLPLLVLAACRAPAPAGPESREPDPPQATLYGVRMETFKGPKLQASGRAAKVTYQRLAADVVATEALIRLPNKATGGRGPAGAFDGFEVRAPSVNGNLGTRRAEAADDVVMRSTDGLVGRTRQVIYDGRAGEAHGTQPAELTGPGYFMRGDRFTLDLAASVFTFEGAVQSRLGGSP